MITDSGQGAAAVRGIGVARLLVLAGAALLALVAVACGGSEKAPSAAQDGHAAVSASTGEVTATVYASPT